MKTLKAGQLWTYVGRQKDSGSFLKILRIDDNCIHVAIRQIQVEENVTDVHHMPFSKEIIENSLLEVVGEESDFPEMEGILQWEAAKGGIFTISIAEALDVVEEVIKSQTPKNVNKGPDV